MDFPAVFGLLFVFVQFGDRGKLCLVRFLNSTVMVRVGGGWVTLAKYLESNDPCRGMNRLHFTPKDFGHFTP